MTDGAKTNRKSDTPASSSVPENSSSAETPSQPGDVKSFPVSSHTKSAPRVLTEESQSSPQQSHGSKTVLKASAAGEETSKGEEPAPADQSLHNDDKAAEEGSVTQGSHSCIIREDKQEKCSGKDGEEDSKTGGDKSTEETKLR